MGHPGMSRHLVFAVENVSTGDVWKIYCSPSLQLSFPFQIKGPLSSPRSAPTLSLPVFTANLYQVNMFSFFNWFVYFTLSNLLVLNLKCFCSEENKSLKRYTFDTSLRRPCSVGEAFVIFTWDLVGLKACSHAFTSPSILSKGSVLVSAWKVAYPLVFELLIPGWWCWCGRWWSFGEIGPPWGMS